MKVKAFPEKPAHPERICWGCDKLCPARDLACGNGTERTQHPIELFGEDWKAWFDAQGLSTTLDAEPKIANAGSPGQSDDAQPLPGVPCRSPRDEPLGKTE